MNTKSILHVTDVSTIYEGEKRPTIKDINFKVNSGELVFVVGPNGSGKTTLLDTLNGLLRSRGEIYVLGHNLQNNQAQIRKHLGYVPQDFMVTPDEPYKALDVVLMGRYGKIGLINRPNKEDLEECYAALELLDAKDLADKCMGKLSGGQQQKIMIARALAKQPDLLLLDEPFSSLDSDSRKKIISILEELSNRGITIVVVTHVAEFTKEMDCRVITMVDGRIISDTGSGETVSQPEKTYIS
jgi:zinc/manganese transport system ATP-binding protein